MFVISSKLLKIKSSVSMVGGFVPRFYAGSTPPPIDHFGYGAFHSHKLYLAQHLSISSRVGQK